MGTVMEGCAEAEIVVLGLGKELASPTPMDWGRKEVTGNGNETRGKGLRGAGSGEVGRGRAEWGRSGNKETHRAPVAPGIHSIKAYNELRPESNNKKNHFVR